jgi:hypothetical protein
MKPWLGVARLPSENVVPVAICVAISKVCCYAPPNTKLPLSSPLRPRRRITTCNFWSEHEISCLAIRFCRDARRVDVRKRRVRFSVVAHGTNHINDPRESKSYQYHCDHAGDVSPAKPDESRSERQANGE